MDRKTHNRAKITINDVLTIRERRAGGESVVSIAADYPISHKQVSLITTGRAWEWAGGARTMPVAFTDEEVYQRWERGELIREIAASLGRVKAHRVGEAIRRAGGRERRHRAIVARCMTSDLTYDKVAEEFGVHRRTVANVLKKAWSAG